MDRRPSSPTIKDVAEYLCLALRYHLLDYVSVVDWADRQIQQQDHPPHWLIELSLSKSQEAACNALSSAQGHCDSRWPWCLLFAHATWLYDQKKRSEDETVAFLCRLPDSLLSRSVDLPADLREQILSIDYSYAWAQGLSDWYRSPLDNPNIRKAFEHAAEELREFLAQHRCHLQSLAKEELHPGSDYTS